MVFFESESIKKFCYYFYYSVEVNLGRAPLEQMTEMYSITSIDLSTARRQTISNFQWSVSMWADETPNSSVQSGFDL